MKKMKIVLGLVITMMVATVTTTSPVLAVTPTNYTRISGQTRFDTAKAIALKAPKGTITDVILASGNNFPDALSVSVLAKKLNAPVLLVDSNVDNSGAAFDFIEKYVQPTATLHIIGGTGVISSEFETKLNSLGFNSIDRIGGYTRYNTVALVANKLAVSSGTPVVIASGTSFPDALSISSIAAANGYPILLTEKDSLSSDVEDFITSDQPSKVYVVGGTAVISDAVQSAVQSILTSPAPDAVTRIAGVDRFETNSKVLSQFSISPKTLFVASGSNFPDALAGSSYAASTGDPIILIDPSVSGLPKYVKSYVKSLYTAGVTPDITAFGGEAVVSNYALSSIRTILDGTPTLEGIVDKAQGKVLDNSFEPNAEFMAKHGMGHVLQIPSSVSLNDDREHDMEILREYVGFNPIVNATSLQSYNMFGAVYAPSIDMEFPDDNNNYIDATLSTQIWDPDPSEYFGAYTVQPEILEVLKLYFPLSYMQVYTLIDNYMAGPTNIGLKASDLTIRNMNDPILGKTYTVDNRTVQMEYDRDNSLNTSGGEYGMVMKLTIGKVQS